jgi:endoglucanase
LTFVSFFFVVFAAERTDLNKIKSSLSKGVNISLLEQYWANPKDLYQSDLTPQLNAIAKAGFNTVRLPVAFDHFMADSYAPLSLTLIQKLNQIYKTCYSLKLNLVIVYHYGKLNNNNLYSENDRIIRIWKQVISAMREHATSNLFFELYNEPTTDMEVWKSSVTTLVRELRKEDPERIFIVGGANYNGSNELMHMGRLSVDDGKILYTFHFYEPYIFTHQGADWTPEKTFITGFPYPFKARRMPGLYNAPEHSLLAQDYNRYPKEASYQYLWDRIRQISEEAQRLNLPLICTETGVINIADKKSRAAYLRDITAIMSEFNLPVMLWDWNDKFAVSDNNKVIRQLRPWLRK